LPVDKYSTKSCFRFLAKCSKIAHHLILQADTLLAMQCHHRANDFLWLVENECIPINLQHNVRWQERTALAVTIAAADGFWKESHHRLNFLESIVPEFFDLTLSTVAWLIFTCFMIAVLGLPGIGRRLIFNQQKDTIYSWLPNALTKWRKWPWDNQCVVAHPSRCCMLSTIDMVTSKITYP
jgi:hypothetical protein